MKRWWRVVAQRTLDEDEKNEVKNRPGGGRISWTVDELLETSCSGIISTLIGKCARSPLGTRQRGASWCRVLGRRGGAQGGKLCEGPEVSMTTDTGTEKLL